MSPVVGKHNLSHLLPEGVSAYHRQEIALGLKRVALQSALYWNAMEAEEFIAPLDSGWSPAEHVRHLTKSMRAVNAGLRLPGWLLWLRFGRPSRVSRHFQPLVNEYKQRLAVGGGAGRFAPSKGEIPTDANAYRRHVLAAHDSEVHKMSALILATRARRADGYFLPHPLLGKLTIREMCLFVLYHNQHHVYVVARRRGESAPA